MKKSWLAVWKMTQGILQILIGTLENVKIGTFMGSFCPTLKKNYKAKNEPIICRSDMCNYTEKRWKIYGEIDLSFLNWHKQFDKFWLKNAKVSNIYTLMDCFWPKYLMFELKKIQRSYVWWHWRLIQNLKENWLALSKNFRLQAEK